MSRTRSQYVSPIGVLTATNFITSGVATITNTRGTNANYTGIITANNVSIGVATITNTRGTNANYTGIITANNVSIGAGNTTLIVQGDVRITGILTVGTASITFNGNNNSINVGSGITFNGSTGIISATEFRGNGANLTGVQPFPSGTLMLFQQTTAPVGWAKSTTHDNKALRVVSGAAGSGGSTAFTSVFASRTPGGSVSGSNSGGSVTGSVSGSNTGGAVANTTATGSVSGSNSGGSVSNTTLTTAQMPSHAHNPSGGGSFVVDMGAGGNSFASGTTTYNVPGSTDNTGGGGAHGHGFTNPSWSGSITMNAHNHTFTNPTWSGSWTQGTFTNPSWSGSFSGTVMDFAVAYVDLIIASKN